jgi:hypothetical protein
LLPIARRIPPSLGKRIAGELAAVRAAARSMEASGGRKLLN